MKRRVREHVMSMNDAYSDSRKPLHCLQFLLSGSQFFVTSSKDVNTCTSNFSDSWHQPALQSDVNRRFGSNSGFIL